ncbi:MAG: malate synthase G [Pseudomonadota bacterium]
MTEYVERSNLKVSAKLADFIEREVLPGLELDPKSLWTGLERLVDRYTEQNKSLLETRRAFHSKIQSWQAQNVGLARRGDEQLKFLQSVGYLVPAPEDFSIDTKDVDTEISSVSGPQLVVPVSNARYAINAANARWGSLYDALYGSDAIMEPPASGGYDEARGASVIKWAKVFLDETWPLEDMSHSAVSAYKVVDGELIAFSDTGESRLKTSNAFRGFVGGADAPTRVLLHHNGLHAELYIDRAHPIGCTDRAGVADIYLESALTTIVDFEDSVAAVDGEDKTNCYRNWLGLMRDDLSETFEKGGKSVIRRLAEDRTYVSPEAVQFSLPGRSRLLVRNVGHLMTTPAVLDQNGDEIFEGLLDAMITSLIAIYGLKNRNLKSVYIVKPKMHGPEEAAFANALFDEVEDILSLDRHTVKIGLMDEERRTSANLSACIYELRKRIIFVNTGFLDRTGDEIHTSAGVGCMVRKSEMANTAWLSAYEKRNVASALSAGFRNRAQIGKGMWAKPDYMAEMLSKKIEHLRAGASCAWVPSPTAATLHAIHYHRVCVADIQQDLSATGDWNDATDLEALLTPPVVEDPDWSAEQIKQELENCCQGILGYVVRWIDQGVGCSKVPDIDDVGLMEDRATLRISCQLLSNWLQHDVISVDELEDVMHRMAAIVDRQNSADPLYMPMQIEPENNIAFQTARELVLSASSQPNGYTEPILHKRRRAFKQRAVLAKAS